MAVGVDCVQVIVSVPIVQVHTRALSVVHRTPILLNAQIILIKAYPPKIKKILNLKNKSDERK